MPSRAGYTFAGWHDADGKKYYDADGKGSANWDKDAATTLYAHWTLQVVFTAPASAAISVDASGNVTASSQTFTSGTVEPIRVTAVKSERLAGAESLFDAASLANVRVTLTPPAGAGSKVEVPLSAPAPGVAAAFAIPKEGTLEVAFGLKLPQGAQLSYDPGDGRAIAQLSYTVAAASAP